MLSIINKILLLFVLILSSNIMGQEYIHVETMPCNEANNYLSNILEKNIDGIENLWNNQNLEIKYLFEEDVIYLRDLNLNEASFYYSFLTLEYDIVGEEDYSKKEHITGSVYAQYRPLRFNFVFNKARIEDFDKNINGYIEKVNTLLGLEITPYKELTNKDFKLINSKIIQHQKNDDYLNKLEIPLLVFLGENAIFKYGGKWKFKEASNRLDNDFIIPYIEVESESVDISNYLFDFLYSDKHKYEKYLFDIEAIIELIKIDIQAKFKITQQNKNLPFKSGN